MRLRRLVGFAFVILIVGSWTLLWGVVACGGIFLYQEAYHAHSGPWMAVGVILFTGGLATMLWTNAALKRMVLRHKARKAEQGQ
jgi:hypothetical protein